MGDAGAVDLGIVLEVPVRRTNLLDRHSRNDRTSGNVGGLLPSKLSLGLVEWPLDESRGIPLVGRRPVLGHSRGVIGHVRDAALVGGDHRGRSSHPV